MLDDIIFDNQILKDDEALLVMANTQLETKDQSGELVVRKACEKWMEYGPCNYVPPIGVEIIERRQKLALDKNEGIYVRDTKSGNIRTVIG